mmetsp:Transcript_23976/g.57841  ORF Transcript_23976/g.57841 Transcript_23976/m.57841 type:complete len:318 (-) Transcript_23976:395-1348(-)
MSLDSREILALPTLELLRVVHEGFVSAAPAESTRVISNPRLRPRTQLPLLYAADGSLHLGRATTAAYGHCRRRFPGGGCRSSSRKDVPGHSDSPSTSPFSEPDVSSLGTMRRRWHKVDSDVGQFSKLVERRQEAEAVRHTAIVSDEFERKRQWLVDALAAQLDLERVDTPQFAARRELPSTYTAPHDAQALREARAPGGFIGQVLELKARKERSERSFGGSGSGRVTVLAGKAGSHGRVSTHPSKGATSIRGTPQMSKTPPRVRKVAEVVRSTTMPQLKRESGPSELSLNESPNGDDLSNLIASKSAFRLSMRATLA